MDSNIEIHVSIDPDKMTAFVRVEPSEKGVEPTRENIVAALEREGVVKGYIEEAFMDLIEAQGSMSKICARGEAPKDGANSKFKFLVEDSDSLHDKSMLSGQIDWRKLENIPSCQAGDKLMRRMPPTPGVDGYNVLGEVLPAVPGKEIPFARRMRGVEQDLEDPDLLRAARGGKPVPIEHGVKIDPDLKLDNVDLSTGSIHFPGSVIVKGNVLPGMEIIVDGDVQVGGTVEAAKIQAGGNVIVKGGVIGQGELREESGALSGKISILKAHGDVRCRFVENSYIESFGSILIDNMVLNSECYAVNEVLVGPKGSKMGDIVGGIVASCKEIKCNKSGSPAEIKTRLEVYTHYLYFEKMKTLREKISDADRLMARMERMKAHVDARLNDPSNPPKIDLKMFNTIFSNITDKVTGAVKEQKSCAEKIKKLEDLKEKILKGRISVAREIHGGTRFLIGPLQGEFEGQRKTVGVVYNEEDEPSLGVISVR